LLNAIVVFKSLVLFITSIIIYLGATRRALVRLGEICLKEYCTEMKYAIKNAIQRVYMSKIIRPSERRMLSRLKKKL